MNETLPEPSISESNIEELTQQKDNVGLLKAAFLLFIRKRLVSFCYHLSLYIAIYIAVQIYSHIDIRIVGHTY